MEMQSTLRDENAKSETCVVYDSTSGRIVLVHEFVGDGTGLYGPQGHDERARISLEDARKHPAAPAQLQVLHVDPDFKLTPGTVYRVDVSARTLVPHRQLSTTIKAGPAKLRSPST